MIFLVAFLTVKIIMRTKSFLFSGIFAFNLPGSRLTFEITEDNNVQKLGPVTISLSLIELLFQFLLISQFNPVIFN